MGLGKRTRRRSPGERLRHVELRKQVVSDLEFRHILITERDKLLRDLERDRKGLMSVYDIDCGWCEDYAVAVCNRVQGATELWMNDLTPFEHICHCVIKYQGRYYDAECIDGVDELRFIPLYENVLKDREEVVEGLRHLIEAHGWMAILDKGRKIYNYHIAISNADRPHAAHAACSHNFPLQPESLLRVPGKRICQRCLERCRLVRGMEAIRRSFKEAHNG